MTVDVKWRDRAPHPLLSPPFITLTEAFRGLALFLALHCPYHGRSDGRINGYPRWWLFCLSLDTVCLTASSVEPSSSERKVDTTAVDQRRL